MKHLLTVVLLSLLCASQVANAGPSYDDQRGSATDLYRDLLGVDNASDLTTGVAIDTGATVMKLQSPGTAGSFLTRPFTPLAGKRWKKVFVRFSAASFNDVALKAYSADGNLLGDLPLVATTQAGFSREADLSAIDFATHPGLRFLVVLDGVGANFAPVIDNLMLTWQPLSTISVAAVPRGAACAGSTVTFDVPVSVSNVRAEGLVVKLAKPVFDNAPRGGVDLRFVSATNGGRQNSGATLAFDALRVAAGDVYWVLPAPIEAGTTFILSATFAVPEGSDDAVQHITTASADALNSDLALSPSATAFVAASPAPRITLEYPGSPFIDGVNRHPAGAAMTTTLTVGNSRNSCPQVYRDVIVVAELDAFSVGGNLALAEAPTSISDSGVFLAPGEVGTYFGEEVTGPAVVWTLASLAPGDQVVRTFAAQLADGTPTGPLAFDDLLTTVARVSSGWDPEEAQATLPLRVGLDWKPDGAFGVGNSYLGRTEITGGANDLALITAADGVPFGFPLRAQNRGLSELRDVFMFFQVPAGLSLSSVAPRIGQEVFYRGTQIGDPTDGPPDYDPAVGLGTSWLGSATGDVRWVAVRTARLASPYYPDQDATYAQADIEVVETTVGATCVLRTYYGRAWFHARQYVDRDTSALLPNPISTPFADVEPINVNSTVPRLGLRIDPSTALRVGAGPVSYKMTVKNGLGDGNTVDAARDASLTIQIPTVDIAGTRVAMSLVSVQGGDATVDLSALASRKIQLRWPTLDPDSTRELTVTLAWPPGGYDGDLATLLATLDAADNFCAPVSVAASVSTELDVRPALLVTKDADLESAQPGSIVNYSIRATNIGDGAGRDTVLFDRVPAGLTLQYVVPPTTGGRVFVSNLEPPLLPSSFANLSQFTASLLSSSFVLATALPDGTWESPFGADTTWVAIELDDPSLSPPRMLTAVELTATLVMVVDELAPDAIVINRAAIDADQVLAAVGRPVRLTITKVPAAKVIRTTPQLVTADETFEYRVATWNASTDPATTLTLVETLPPGATFVSASFAWNEASAARSGVTVTPVVAPDGRTVTFAITDAVGQPLDSLEGGTVTFRVHIDEDVASNQYLDFTTDVTIANAELPSGVVVSASSSVRVSNADLRAGISADRLDPIGGDTINVTLVVANDDLHVASNTSVSLRIPAALGYVASSALVLAPGYAFAGDGEPVISEVSDNGEVIAHDLTWATTNALGLTGFAGDIRGQSGPIAIALRLQLAQDTPARTDLPLVLTLGTSTGQGPNAAPDVASVALRTPDADPGVDVVLPDLALPEDTLTTVIRYGNYTRQPAGAAVTIVSLPHQGATLTSTYLGLVATNQETLWFHAGPVTSAPEFDPADPAGGGWQSTPEALAGPVSFIAIQAANLPAKELRSVFLKTSFTSPITGDLALGGTRHDVCATIVAPDSGNESVDNDSDCEEVAIPGVNLAASLTGTPAGASPGVAVGETVSNTLTITNAGTVASYGNRFTFAPGLLVPVTDLGPDAKALIVGAGGLASRALLPDGSTWSGAVPITVDGDTFYLGSLASSDPLYYRNIGLRAGDAVSVIIVSDVPETLSNGTAIQATLTVANDGLVDPGPGPIDPEDLSDNVATFAVTAWRPDLFVQLAATDLTGASGPVRPGEAIRWTTTYNNLGGIDATDVAFTSTIPDGTRYVIGSLADVPPGFTPEYLGPSGWGYTPVGADGDEDPAVRAIRLGGASLESPVNPYYRATSAQLEAGTSGRTTRFVDDRVSSSTDDGDVWRSEVIGVGADVQQWARVQLDGRGGDDPLYVRVIDPDTNATLPGYDQVAVDVSGSVDLAGISASIYPQLVFEVVFGGRSPVCDIGSGWSVRIQGTGRVPINAVAGVNPPGVAESFVLGAEGGNNCAWNAQPDGTWLPTTSCAYLRDTTLFVTETYSVFYDNVWYDASYAGMLRFSTNVGNQEWDIRQLMTTAEVNSSGWPFSTHYRMVWSERNGGLTATTSYPFEGRPRPALVRFFGTTPTLTKLPVPDETASYDFDGQGDWHDDVTFARELGDAGRVVVWTQADGTWSASPIARPANTAGDLTLRVQEDQPIACATFQSNANEVYTAYVLRPADGTYTSLTALPLGAQLDSARCRGAHGGGVFSGTVAGAAAPEGAPAFWFPDASAADGSGYRLIVLPADGLSDVVVSDRNANGYYVGSGTANSLDQAIVWLPDGAAFSGHAIADSAGMTRLWGLDDQNVVYTEHTTGTVAHAIDPTGVSTTHPLQPAGWAPLTGLRRLGRSFTFHGVGLASQDLNVFRTVRFDAASGSVIGYERPERYDPTYVRARFSQGKIAAGEAQIPGGWDTAPALFVPNGEGPDGWGVELLPKPAGIPQTIIAAINEDGTIAVADGNDPQYNYHTFAYKKVGTTWSMTNLSELTGYTIRYPSRPYSNYFNNSPSGLYVIFSGSFYSVMYFDKAAPSGVRVFIPQDVDGVPASAQSAWSFSLQPAGGPPLMVTRGNSRSFVYSFIDGVQTGVMLPGPEGLENCSAQDIVESRAAIVGYCSPPQGYPTTAVQWTREAGTWTVEVVGEEGTNAYLAANDGSIYSYRSSSSSYGFYQKRAGAWTFIPLETRSFQNVGSVQWSDNRDLVRNNQLFSTYTDYQNGNKSYLLHWRTPAPHESVAPLTAIETPAGLVINDLDFHRDGVFKGTMRDSNNNYVPVFVQRQPDASWTTTRVGDPALRPEWDYYNFEYGANQPGFPFEDDVTEHQLAFLRDGVPTLVNVYPDDYAEYRTEVQPVPGAEIHPYGSWQQGLLYGCKMASDASFSGFAVKYRAAGNPGYSFVTQVDADTCQPAVSGETMASSARLDGNEANNQASASMKLATADLEVALTTSSSVAQVGGPISWVVTIANQGPSPASNVMLSFTPAGGTAVSIQVGPLAVGERRELPFSGGTVPDVPDGTLLNAVASVSSELDDCDELDDLATAATLVANQPNAWVALDVPATSFVGATFKATVSYGNDTAFTIAPGEIDVSLPAWLSVVNGSVAQSFGTLAPGQGGEYTLDLVANDCAQIGASADITADLTSANDYIDIDNQAVATTVVNDSGRLGIDLVADRVAVGLGETATWVAWFGNSGERPSQATLTVTLPSSALATFVPAGTTPGFVRSGDTLTWDIGDVSPGVGGSVMFAVTRTAASGALAPTAAITSPGDCPTAASDTASVGAAAPGVHIATAVADGYLGADETTRWSVLVSNDGSGPVAGLTVTDLVPAALSYVSGSLQGPGASAVSAPTLSWNLGAVPAGQAFVLSFETTAPATVTSQSASASWTGGSANSDATPLHPDGDGMPRLGLRWDATALSPDDTFTATLAYGSSLEPLGAVMLTTALGDHLELVAAPGAQVADGQVTWALGALAAGASGEVSMTLRVVSDTASGTVLFGRAALTAEGVPPQTSNDVLAMVIDCDDDNSCTIDAYSFNVGCAHTNNGAYLRETSCGRGVCAAVGAETCVNGGLVDSCQEKSPTSATEICNGLDDNCDGNVNEGIAPVATTCGKGQCAATGSITCQGTALVDSCTPKASSAEICDGLDNDCDDVVDNGLPTVETSCGVGACAGNVGIDHCVAGAQINTCNPLAGASAEVCNGIDDDCNGTIDMVNGASICPALDTIIVTGPDALTARALATFTFDLANDVAGLGFECRLDSGAWARCDSGTKSYTVSPGAHTFQVRGIGMDGAIDPTPAVASWTYDPSAPDTFIDVGPADPSQSGDAHFELSSTNPDDALMCALDVPAPRPEDHTPCDPTTNFVGLADGRHTLSVYAINTLGVADPTPAEWTWTIDSSLPETLITAGPTGTSAIDDAVFSFTSPGGEGDETFECRIDGGAFVPCTPGVSYPVSEGAHTFDVRAVDAAGNVDPTPATQAFVVDRTAPVVTIVTGPDDPTASHDADFTLSANETPVTYYCALTLSEPAAADYQPCSDAPSYSDIADGEHQLWVIAKDTAGNVSEPDEWAWTVDSRVLETEITAGPASITTATEDAAFAYRDPSAGLTTFDCRLDGGAWQPCDGGSLAIVASALGVGPHVFEVRSCARDLQVCDETPAVWRWEVSASPCPLDAIAPSITCAGDVALQCGATPDLASLMASASDACGVTVRLLEEPASYPLGATPLVYVATDGNGNEATCSLSIVVADTLAPILMCPGPTTVVAEADQCGATPTWVEPTVSDACAESTVVLTNDAPATAPVGVSTVTWTATDSSGQQATCTTTVTVEDDTPPTIACGVPSGGIPMVATPSAEDACGTTLQIEQAVCITTDDAGVEQQLPAAACPVTVSESDVSIADGFAVDVRGRVTIRWAVVAVDPAGNEARQVCSTDVDLGPAPVDMDDFIASGSGGCAGGPGDLGALALGLTLLALGLRARRS